MSGLLAALQDKKGVAIMADRGFTFKDMLKDLNIDLTIPPFLKNSEDIYHKKNEARERDCLTLNICRASY